MNKLRKIIEIDEEKCTGCGECVPSCAEGALQIVDGKARLVKDVYCDGLGACLGECPEDALTIVEREAEEFDEKAVEEYLKEQAESTPRAAQTSLACGCPGAAMQTFCRDEEPAPLKTAPGAKSQLRQWPVQIMLVPPQAPFLKNADILVTADCVPFAMPDFHDRFLRGRTVLVGCPKLDNLDFYVQRLEEIFREAAPASITVLRMEVPCCGGIAQAAVQARDKAELDIPVEVYTASVREGNVTQETVLPATETAKKQLPTGKG